MNEESMTELIGESEEDGFATYASPTITVKVVDEDAENVDTLMIDYEDNQLILFLPAYATNISFDERAYRKLWKSHTPMAPARSCINYGIDGTKQARSCIFFSPSEDLLITGSRVNPLHPYYNALELEPLCLNPALKVREGWIATSHPACQYGLHKACPFSILEDWHDVCFVEQDEMVCTLQCRLGGLRTETYRVITQTDESEIVNISFDRGTSLEQALTIYEEYISATYTNAKIRRSEVEETPPSSQEDSLFGSLLMETKES